MIYLMKATIFKLLNIPFKLLPVQEHVTYKLTDVSFISYVLKLRIFLWYVKSLYFLVKDTDFFLNVFSRFTIELPCASEKKVRQIIILT